MKLYINVGDGLPMSPESIALIRQCGFHGVRRDVPTAEAAGPLADEMAREKWHPIFLVGSGTSGKMATDNGPLTPDDIAPLAEATARAALASGLFDRDPPAAFEIGNEPDIAVGYYAAHPPRFARAVTQAFDAIRAVSAHAIVITGGTIRTDGNGLGYIRAVLAAGIPPECHIGYHTYREAVSPDTSYKGFKSRSDEFTALRDIVGERPIWCTESGWHTAPHKRYKKIRIFGRTIDTPIPDGTFRYTDTQVAEFVRREIEINHAHGARGYVLYQLNDGQDPNVGLHTFGIRDHAGNPKRVADTIRQIAPQYA